MKTIKLQPQANTSALYISRQSKYRDYNYWKYKSCCPAAPLWNPPSQIAWLAPVPSPAAACLREWGTWACSSAWLAAVILLKAIERSYARMSAGERVRRGAGAGGGRGVEAIPGGVGLLPQEHCNDEIRRNINQRLSQKIVGNL